MGKIFIIDVTNRDGVQAARLSLSKLEKTILNLYLGELGIYQSEAGFPTVHHESRYLQANIELSDAGILHPIKLSGWVRSTSQDIETAFRLVPNIRHLNLSTPVSDQMIKGKLAEGKSRQDIISSMSEAVDAAKARGAEIIGVNAEDASRTSLNHLLDFGCAARDAGADRFRYCDTLGYDNPFSIYETTRKLTEVIEMPVEIHCHGDLGMAVANSIAGAKGVIDGGQDAFINTTVNGIGERAGNADLLSVILAVRKSKDFSQRYPLADNVDLSQIWNIARFTSYAFGVPIPINQPGVGSNAFAHSSGIHANAVLKDPYNYELYDYTELGRGARDEIESGREICTGEYGGMASLRHILNNIFTKEEVLSWRGAKLEEIAELVAYASVESQKPLHMDEIRFIALYPQYARKLLTLEPPASD